MCSRKYVAKKKENMWQNGECLQRTGFYKTEPKVNSRTEKYNNQN